MIATLDKYRNGKSSKLTKTIGFRLLFSVISLAFLTFLLGLIALYWLNQINQNITSLHQKTIFTSTRSLYLIKEITDLSGSAPFIFNLDTHYRIENEGMRLAVNITKIRSLWSEWLAEVKSTPQIDASSANLIYSLDMTDEALRDYIQILANINSDNEKLFLLELQLMGIDSELSSNNDLSNSELSKLKTIMVTLTQALHSGDLISLGEHQRHYLALISDQHLSPIYSHFDKLRHKIFDISSIDNGIFLLRESVLKKRLEASRKLLLIQHLSRNVNAEIIEIADSSERLITQRRIETSGKIKTAQYIILFVFFTCLLIAFITIIYINRYVLSNLNKITDSMLKLAHGESKTKISITTSNTDEISDLIHAFDIFRVNAKKIESLLDETQQKSTLIQNTLSGMSDGVLVADENRNILVWNTNFPNLLEINPVIMERGSSLESCLSNSLFIKAANIKPHKVIENHKISEYSSHGLTLEIRKSKIKSGGSIWFVSDITDTRQIRERIQSLEQLEKLGQVAGSVAHDFNNILTAIIGNLDILATKIDNSDKSKSAVLDRAHNAAEIGTSLTQRLLAFAKKQHLNPEIIEINELVHGLIDLLDFSTGKEVGINFTPHKDPIHIKIDASQLELSLLNICLNSAQSITNEGMIKIFVKKDLDDSCELIIEDTGCGIEAEIIDKVFEPFFTNRPDGKGTGLGLSMVFGFIKQTGGSISIDSKPGRGTKLIMTLPIVKKNHRKSPPELKSVTSNIKSGTLESVLIVEDEDNLRLATEDNFINLGFNVKSTDDAVTANKLISTEPFDILFTDIYLQSQLDGWVLARKMVKKNPNAHIIVTSATIDHNDIPTDIEGLVQFIPKPYTSKDIKSILKKISITSRSLPKLSDNHPAA